MRLKTLRKERPAFENEGAVVNGNRMDLSNSELKPTKYRTNNTFVLPTSLSNEVSSLNIYSSNQTPDTNTNHRHYISTTRRNFPVQTPSQPTRTSSYQAIEAAYLEHGIRIHINPSTVATGTQQQNLSTENLNARKPTNIIQRHRAFANRIPSRSSSALDYPPVAHETRQDSRPFSALQQTSTVDFDQVNTNNTSYIQTNENPNSLQLTNMFCSSSILTSEHSDHVTLPNQLTITNGTSSTDTLINNDPDLAYMSSLLKTTTGDTFRDTIRRRAGLRATFAVHRNPQYAAAATAGASSKMSEKSSVTHSQLANHPSSFIRTPTIVPPPTIFTPSSKKIEKDILKHASRIRTNHIRDSFLRHQNSLQSQIPARTPSVSNSPIRSSPYTKRSKTLKPSKTISLEPLELLLAPSPQPLSSVPSRATSLILHGRPAINHDHSHGNLRPSRKRTTSPKISYMEDNNGTPTTFYPNEQLNSLYLTDDSLPLMKTSPLDLITTDKIRQSNSSDSGCYDRSSSSGDTHSITSFSINQATSSVPSVRLTSSSTRRSHIMKKVSFEDQSFKIVIPTATYV